MKRTVISIMLAAMAICAGAKEKTLRYEFGDIERIEAGYNFKIHVTEGDSGEVEIVADSELERYIIVRYSGNKAALSLQMDELPRKIRNSQIPPVEVYITMDHIRSIDISGAASIYFEGQYSADNLDIELSGASSLHGLRTDGNLLSIDCSGAADADIYGNIKEDVDIDCSGAGKIRLAGKGKSFMIDGSGAADINARNFTADNVTVNLSGASKAEVYASKELRYDVGIACNMTYFGEARPVNVSKDANVVQGIL